MNSTVQVRQLLDFNDHVIKRNGNAFRYDIRNEHCNLAKKNQRNKNWLRACYEQSFIKLKKTTLVIRSKQAKHGDVRHSVINVNKSVRIEALQYTYVISSFNADVCNILLTYCDAKKYKIEHVQQIFWSIAE
jgi:hypothetical protein